MEYVNHFTAVRLRLRGTGVIRGTLYSYDEVFSDPLFPTVMNATTADVPTLLANFTSFTAKLDMRTTGIDEIFDISQIIIYSKPVATGFPQ